MPSQAKKTHLILANRSHRFEKKNGAAFAWNGVILCYSAKFSHFQTDLIMKND